MKNYLIIRGTEEQLVAERKLIRGEEEIIVTAYEKTARNYTTSCDSFAEIFPLLITNGKDYTEEQLKELGEKLGKPARIYKVSSYEMNESNLLVKLDVEDSKYLLVDVNTKPHNKFQDLIGKSGNIIAYCQYPLLNSDNMLDFSVNKSSFYFALVSNKDNFTQSEDFIVKSLEILQILSSRPRNEQKKLLKAQLEEYVNDDLCALTYIKD